MKLVNASDVLFLSPHLDDVILSCGGQLWKLVHAGSNPRIATVFTASPDQAAQSLPFAQYQHDLWGNPPSPMLLRQHEDRTAGARLGIHTMIHLPLHDAVYRHTVGGEPLYSSNEDLFGDLHPADENVTDQIVTALEPYMQIDTTVVAPLGIGHHVDHQLVHRAGARLLDAGYTVIFYEELPYAEKADAFAEMPAGVSSFLVELSEEDIVAKLYALHYYQTQIPVLYASADRMNECVRTYAAQIAQVGVAYAERLWKPVHPDD